MKQALIKLHLAVFLAGFTGILGKLIGLNEGLLVWYRIAITVITLYAWLRYRKQLGAVPAAAVYRLLGVGSLIALHWVFFYGSIKMANVSIGLVCFASVGFFTALLEPMFTPKKISWAEIGLGLLSLLGIYLIFHFDMRYRSGILVGLVSAILAAFFSALNKRYVTVTDSKTMMLYELSGGLLVLTLGMPLYLHYFPPVYLLPTASDWLWLLILSWLCTVLAMDLMLQSLKKVSAFTQNLSLNLEPVYGILMAFFLFHENASLSASFYPGVGLIALSVVLQMLRVVRRKRQ